jgi:hypothetical protein
MSSPYWYWRPLKQDWVIDENTTNRFMLPEQGHISGLAIQLQAKNETYLGSYDRPYPIQRITNRILGNGNFDIINIKGRHMHALNFWDSGRMIKEGHTEVDTEQQLAFYYLPFGRKLGDKKYGLILENFAAGVEFEDSNDISTTYLQDANTKYSIWALMRKNPEPDLFSGGYLRKRQLAPKDAASETQYGVKLPTINKLRGIHLFSEPTVASGVLSTTLFTLTQTLWLSIKSREEYILDSMPSDEWARHIHYMLGREAHTQIRAYSQTGGGYHDTMIAEKRNSQVQLLQRTVPAVAIGDASTDETQMQRISTYDMAGTELISRYMALDTFGICLHGHIPLLMTKPDADEDEFLDAGADKDVYVEVTEGSSAGNWFIVLDEVQKTYG